MPETKRKQLSLVLPPRTNQQIADLKKQYGTATAVIIAAIDRMWREEIGK